MSSKVASSGWCHKVTIESWDKLHAQYEKDLLASSSQWNTSNGTNFYSSPLSTLWISYYKILTVPRALLMFCLHHTLQPIILKTMSIASSMHGNLNCQIWPVNVMQTRQLWHINPMECAKTPWAYQTGIHAT